HLLVLYRLPRDRAGPCPAGNRITGCRSMALLRIDHTSESARLNLPLYIILPDPGRMGDLPVRGRKVLYLLHGLSDDGSAWQRYTSIEYLAMAYGLVVVMPSVGRSFYTD